MAENRTDDVITYIGIADIIKVDKNADGSRTITGVISSPKVDLDRQIMDPAFLKRAATDWFTKRANIREMHQPLAVGKGKELVEDPNGFLVLTSKIVEPSTVKKIDEGILSGYSVGIKNGRIVRDATAPAGRIVDGTMIECSLVDYPAGDVGKFTIAKAASPDEDTGAIALTADELKAVDADLTKAPPSAEGEGAGADVAKAAAASTSPTASTNLSRDALRASALQANPAATADQLDALCDAWELLTAGNQRATGIPGEKTPIVPAATDTEAGKTPEPAKDAAASAPPEAGTEPARLSIDELWGSLKSALVDDKNDIRALLADMAKAAVPDLVKAAVEEATKGLTERVVKLEKSPQPSGPYVGSARAFAVNETIDSGNAAHPVLLVNPVRARLEAMAKETDPVIRKAAEAALAQMPVATT